MPFTDAQLAAQMGADLVNSGVMTQVQLTALLTDPTPDNVRETLTAPQLANFNAYWAALGQWMNGVGGNITATSGNDVPGRQVNGVDAPVPAGIPAKVLYNDAFNDVQTHLGQPGFSVVMAVAAQLRFIEHM